MSVAMKADEISELIRNMTETQLVELVSRRSSETKWLVGAAAEAWTKRFARGRTDRDFGEMAGLSGDSVFQRRRVWEVFGDKKDEFPRLTWTHFFKALTWSDATECLDWAALNEATVAEMTCWRRMKHGLPLDSDDEQAETEDIEPTASTSEMTAVDRRSSATTTTAAISPHIMDDDDRPSVVRTPGSDDSDEVGRHLSESESYKLVRAIATQYLRLVKAHPQLRIVIADQLAEVAVQIHEDKQITGLDEKSLRGMIRTAIGKERAA